MLKYGLLLRNTLSMAWIHSDAHTATWIQQAGGVIQGCMTPLGLGHARAGGRAEGLDAMPRFNCQMQWRLTDGNGASSSFERSDRADTLGANLLVPSR